MWKLGYMPTMIEAVDGAVHADPEKAYLKRTPSFASRPIVGLVGSPYP